MICWCSFLVVVDLYEYDSHRHLAAAVYADSISPLTPSSRSVFAINRLSNPIVCDPQLNKEMYNYDSSSSSGEEEPIGEKIKREAAKKSEKKKKVQIYDSQESSSSDEGMEQLGADGCSGCMQLFNVRNMEEMILRYKCFGCMNHFHPACLPPDVRAQLDAGDTWFDIKYTCKFCKD